MDVRLQQGDVGLAIAAIAAVVLIGGFLIATSGSPDEDAADTGRTTTTTTATTVVTTTTTPAPRTGLVRIPSEADADLEWSTARGAFRVECVDGEVQWLDAKVVALPPGPRYGWRVLVDEATGETAPLSSRPGMRNTLTQGDGSPSDFRASPGGRSTARFTFSELRPRLIVDLVLTVHDVEPEQARVITVPALTCRGS